MYSSCVFTSDDIPFADDRRDQLPGIVHGNVFRNVDIVAVSFCGNHSLSIIDLLTASAAADDCLALAAYPRRTAGAAAGLPPAGREVAA